MQNKYVDWEWMWKSLLWCVVASVAFVSRTFVFIYLCIFFFTYFFAHWILSGFVQFDRWIVHTSRVPACVFFISLIRTQLLALLTHWMRDSHNSVSIVFTVFAINSQSQRIVTASHLVFSFLFLSPSLVPPLTPRHCGHGCCCFCCKFAFVPLKW